MYLFDTIPQKTTFCSRPQKSLLTCAETKKNTHRKQNKTRTKQNKIYTLTGRLWKGNLSLLSVDPRVAKSTVLHPYSTSSI